MRGVMIWAVASLLVGSTVTIASGNLVAGIYLGSTLMIGSLCWKAGEIFGYNLAISEMGNKKNNVRIIDPKPNPPAKVRNQRPAEFAEEGDVFVGEVVVDEQREAAQF